MKQRIGIWMLLLGLYLGIHNDHLALLYHSCPVQIFPYRVSVYPDQDRELLSNGIRIDSSAALSRILEDYFS